MKEIEESDGQFQRKKQIEEAQRKMAQPKVEIPPYKSSLDEDAKAVNRANQISMGMKYRREVQNITDTSRKVLDYISLDNGKTVKTESLMLGESYFSKKQSLFDELGRWVKTKLVMFDGSGKKFFIQKNSKV